MHERQATTALIRCLMEVDARRLYLPQGYSSLFAFCTQALHLSEHAAYGRIEVARAARRLPALLAHLEDGSITVTNARMLAPHMTDANCEALLAAARHRSKRDVEELIARLKPEPDVPSAVRKLPAARVVQSQSTTAPPTSVSDLNTTKLPSTQPAVPSTCRSSRGRSSRHSHPSDTRSSSRRPAPCTRSCATRRICCGTSSLTGTSRQCSIARCPR